MSTATLPRKTIRPELAVYSSRELAAFSEKDLHTSAPLRKNNPALWEAACAYADSSEFRTALSRREFEGVKPNPAPPPPAEGTSRLTREELRPALRAIGRFIKRTVGERMSGVAAASRVLEIETELREQIVALQERAARDEKRIATSEARFDAQARHLRNLEAKVSGVGEIERSARVSENQWPPSGVTHTPSQEEAQ